MQVHRSRGTSNNRKKGYNQHDEVAASRRMAPMMGNGIIQNKDDG
jgi:hypothetical protein